MTNHTREPTAPETVQSPVAQTDSKMVWPSLTIDFDLYDQMLEEADLTDTQRHEVIEALWNFMVGFVDLGIGIHPLQQATANNCEQNGIPAEFIKSQPGNVVSSNNNPKTKFTAAAGGATAPSQDRSQT